MCYYVLHLSEKGKRTFIFRKWLTGSVLYKHNYKQMYIKCIHKFKQTKFVDYFVHYSNMWNCKSVECTKKNAIFIWLNYWTHR